MAIQKNITIDGIDVPFKASAAVPRLYRLKFRRDIYQDFAALQKSVGENTEESSALDIESLEVFENIAYIMQNTPMQPFRHHRMSGWNSLTRSASMRSCRS